MKLLPLLLCLLLCGCTLKAQEPATEIPTVTTAATIPETEPVSMYQPGHPLEEANRGALRVNPLTMRKVQGMRTMGEDLILFSGYGSTTLTRLTGRDLTVAGEMTLNFELDPESPSVQISKDTLCYYDPQKQEIVLLDKDWNNTHRYILTEQILGDPIASSDRNTIYYCTHDAIRVWDLHSGIHRTVKELAYDDQQLTGLHLNDTVLQCRIQDGDTIRTLFLDAASGQLLQQYAGDVTLTTHGNHYYATLPAAGLDLLVFGRSDSAPQILYPAELVTASFFLPSKNACVTVSQHMGNVCLSYYELDTGRKQGELLLPALQTPKAILPGTGSSLSILTYDPAADCDTVYRWDVPAGTDRKSHIEPFVSQTSLAKSTVLAAQLEEKYGIRIRVGEDALSVQPWDYSFEAETLDPVLCQELEALDARLSQYPKEVLDQTAAHFDSLTIALVRSITGTPESGSLAAATGVQFLDGEDAYVTITVGKYAEQALYHELFHVMETHILAESTAFDQWEDLNPIGFQYHYGTGFLPEWEPYLSGESRAFVDAYSTTFPKEDRARILENAILPGNAQLFRTSVMQAKLAKLCHGIRQAYGLKKSPETFIWEQYLNFPLAYSEKNATS